MTECELDTMIYDSHETADLLVLLRQHRDVQAILHTCPQCGRPTNGRRCGHCDNPN